MRFWTVLALLLVVLVPAGALGNPPHPVVRTTLARTGSNASTTGALRRAPHASRVQRAASAVRRLARRPFGARNRTLARSSDAASAEGEHAVTAAPPLDLSRVDLIVFDEDGTLADTRVDVVRAALGAARDVAGKLVTGHLAPAAPGSRGGFVSRLQQTARAAYQSRYFNLDRWARPYPGVSEALAALKGARPGLKIALASNQATDDAGKVVRDLGLSQHFDAIEGADQGRAPKPAGDVVAAAARATGVDPARAIMVGDLFTDVQAGKNAGTAATVRLSRGYASQALLQRILGHSAQPTLTVGRIPDLLPAFGLDKVALAPGPRAPLASLPQHT